MTQNVVQLNQLKPKILLTLAGDLISSTSSIDKVADNEIKASVVWLALCCFVCVIAQHIY